MGKLELKDVGWKSYWTTHQRLFQVSFLSQLAPSIHSISVWIERFSVLAATLTSGFSHKAPELFAYQAFKVQVERTLNCRWVAHNRCYQCELLAQKGLDWSIPNGRLYMEAFIGHARVIPRCSFCPQEDHFAQVCSQNPNHPWFSWLSNSSNSTPTQQWSQSLEYCCCYNNGRCKQAPSACRYTHRCADCGGPHLRISSPRGGQRGNARPRFPKKHTRERL